MGGAAFFYGRGKSKDLWGGAGQGKSKDIRMRHPSHDSDRERGKRDPERVTRDSDRGLLGTERAIREIGRGSIALFHSSSLFRPLALRISSHFLSVSPFPRNPFPWFHHSVLPWSEAYITSSSSQDILHQIVMKYSQDFHVARNVYWGYLFITFCCNRMFLPLACSFMLGRLTYSSPNKY